MHDSYLQPIGCTNFDTPLRMALTNATHCSDKTIKKNLIFMTDGYHNEGSLGDVYQLCPDLKNTFTTISIIEYGWNCDRETLTQIAKRSDGILIFAENSKQLIEHSDAAFSNTDFQIFNNETPLPTQVVFLDKQNQQIVVHKKLDDHRVKVPTCVVNIQSLSSEIGIATDDQNFDSALIQEYIQL
ncbi:MAG: VWA domain-containing protein [Sphingobacteriaceae bacterium]|nr:MAG: VWA domain-containing protein [Sphingobacteriaceae bacterium]